MHWILCSPGPLNPAPPAPLAYWVQEIAAGPKLTFGEVEDCAEIPGILANGWACAVIPEYIIAHSFVASIRSPEGRYAMLFFHAVGKELHQQPRQAGPELIGWFHIRLCNPVIDRRSVVKNIRHAMALLISAGHVPPGALGASAAEA